MGRLVEEIDESALPQAIRGHGSTGETFAELAQAYEQINAGSAS